MASHQDSLTPAWNPLAINGIRKGRWPYDHLHPKVGGPPMQDSGKYITVYQRKPGDTWRIARDIWNSSNPLPDM